MRALLASLLVALAACGVTVDEPTPDAAPSPLAGSWRVSWACESGCGTAPGRPSLTYSMRLEIADVALLWRDDDCSECAADQLGMPDGDCLRVAAGDEGALIREAYTLCAWGGELVGSVSWRSRYIAAATTWAVRGAP